MAELVTFLILLSGLVIAGSMVHLERKGKAYLRLRRMRNGRKFRREWNPRSTAYGTVTRMDIPKSSARPQPAGTVSPIRRQAQDRNVVIRTDTGSFGGLQ